MGLPKGLEPGWWKKELDRLGEGTVHAPCARPEITRPEVDRNRLCRLYWLTIAALKTNAWPSRAGFVKREIVY